VKARSILLDGGFVAAITDDTNPLHDPVIAMYATLIDQYQQGGVRLFAPSTVLMSYDRFVRRGALAPIETTWVARQHRNAAAAIDAPSSDIALALVLMRRERFSAIATTLAFYDEFDIEVIRPLPDTEIDVSSRTEPMPARQSTGE